MSLAGYRKPVTEIIGLLFLAATVVGAVFARWWIVMVPFVLVAVWVAYAAASGGQDRDGMPAWQMAASFGFIMAAPAALGLTAGVILGQYLRDLGSGRRPAGGRR